MTDLAIKILDDTLAFNKLSRKEAVDYLSLKTEEELFEYYQNECISKSNALTEEKLYLKASDALVRDCYDSMFRAKKTVIW